MNPSDRGLVWLGALGALGAVALVYLMWLTFALVFGRGPL